jgi:hypothetical protein
MRLMQFPSLLAVTRARLLAALAAQPRDLASLAALLDLPPPRLAAAGTPSGGGAG